MAFASWVSQRERGRTYRLPSEAEWEYAARAGTKTSRYWNGGDDECVRHANVLDLRAQSKLRFEVVADWDDGFAVTAPVGSFLPNAWGLYDVLGNVYEWCADWMGDYPADDAMDPRGPPQGDWKVLRGGSWMGSHKHARAARRLDSAPEVRYGSYGFRLVAESGAPR